MTDSTDSARGPERIWVDRYNYWANPTHKDEKTEYIRADLAPDPLGAVKVKPLVWAQIESTLPRVVFKAKTMLGSYVAWPDGRWKLHGRNAGFQTIGETLETAKAAAQADYEQRILSALEHDPQGERVKALMYQALRPFARQVDKATCKITMTWEDGDYKSTYTNTLTPQDFFKAADAIRALKDQTP